MRSKTSTVALRMLSSVLCVFVTLPVSAGQNTDSLRFAKESQHFVFYSSPGDLEVLDSLAIVLENSYARITGRLGTQMEKKVDVRVYPDLRSFHAAINYPDAPDWVVGSSIDDELLVVSPLNPGSIHTYKSLMQVVVREFAHIAVYAARGEKGSATLPRWLSEGYAQYEAGQINDVIRRSVKNGLTGKTPPTWAQLNAASPMEFGYMNGYALSVTIVEFLTVSYGIDKLVLLIKEPENIENIYGVSTTELEKQWMQYLINEQTE